MSFVREHCSVSKYNSSVAVVRLPFPVPLSRCYPLLYRLPKLHLLCADETCGAE